MSDLRSQQVKELAILLTTLAEVGKDHLKLLLRDTYVQIFDGVKVPHKLMSGYVDESILSILRNGTFKFLIPALIQEINESKAGRVRERFLVSSEQSMCQVPCATLFRTSYHTKGCTDAPVAALLSNYVFPYLVMSPYCTIIHESGLFE